MKTVLILSALLAFASCGKKANEDSEKAVEENSEKLLCATSLSSNKIIPPKVKLSREVIDKVEAEFQGRPFNRAAFWNVLSREARLPLNIELASYVDVPEDVLYRAVVLYFENHLNAPNEDLVYRNSSTEVYIMDASKTNNSLRVNCEDPKTSIAGIEISKVIFASTQLLDQTCRVNGTTFQLSIYDEHVILKIGNELTGFSRAEIIRAKDENNYRLTALNPDQRSLELTLSKDEDEMQKRRISLRYSGQNSIYGSGSCRPVGP
jgi:hypothetical protein